HHHPTVPGAPLPALFENAALSGSRKIARPTAASDPIPLYSNPVKGGSPSLPALRAKPGSPPPLPFFITFFP
ncbi:MAG: hypothetical protein ABSG70_04065, partial [Terriglobales bacterium]